MTRPLKLCYIQTCPVPAPSRVGRPGAGTRGVAPHFVKKVLSPASRNLQQHRRLQQKSPEPPDRAFRTPPTGERECPCQKSIPPSAQRRQGFELAHRRAQILVRRWRPPRARGARSKSFSRGSPTPSPV